MCALTDASRDELLKIRTMVEALLEKSGVSSADLKKSKSSVEKPKKKGVAGWWSAFTAKVLEENKEEWRAFAAQQETKQGAHLKWLKLKGYKKKFKPFLVVVDEHF
jgi:hypothetical protein